jgi:hypothetical protein
MTRLVVALLHDPSVISDGEARSIAHMDLLTRDRLRIRSTYYYCSYYLVTKLVAQQNKTMSSGETVFELASQLCIHPRIQIIVAI